MNENKVKVWLARDKGGALWVYPSIPFRDNDMWFCDEPITQLDSSNFPSVKWEDDQPTEAYITLANELQKQPKKEIDCEQRRYELAKDLYLRYEDIDEKGAIRSADALINELKKAKQMNYDITMCGNTNCKKRLDCLRYATHEAYRSDKGNKPPYVSMAYVPDTEKCDLFVKIYRR